MLTRLYLQLLTIIFVLVQLLFVSTAIAASNSTKEDMSSSIASKKMVRVGYIEFPPVFSTDSQGKAVGSLIRLTKRVLEHAGYEMQFQSFPAKRMAKNLVDGKVDLWVGLSSIPIFANNTLIGQSEVMRITLQSYSLGKADNINTQEDLYNKSIIILRGYSYGGWIHYIKDPKNKVHYLEVDTHQKALELLSHARADFLLDYKGPINRALKSIQIAGLRSQQISSFPAKFVVSKARDDARQLLQDIESSYRTLKSQGL